MKKYSKFLAIMLVFAMILPGIAQAAPVAGSTQVERVAGAGREETAIAASKVAYPAGATNVVLAGYAGEVDALTGTLLANEMKAPLLLTRAYKLTEATKAEITRLGAKTVYVLGGEKVVSKAVVTELEAMNITVERIDGDNRYETAVMAGEKSGTQTKKVFLAKGLGILADALAVGPASAKEDMPVLLTQSNMLPEATKAALKDWSVTNVTLVGGKVAITPAVVTELEAMNITVDRVEGLDREKTAVAIADKYFAGSKNAIVANGYVYADALVGGYLGALQNAPIVLVDTNVLKADSTGAHLAKVEKAWILGGVNAVNATTANKVVAAIEGDVALDLKVKSVSAINGKQIQVTFSKAVDTTTVLDTATGKKLLTGVVTLGGVDQINQPASFDEAKKVLTVDVITAFTKDESRVISIKDIKDEQAQKVELFASTVTANEKIAPAVKSITAKTNAAEVNQVSVEFTEPVSFASIKIDGKFVTAGTDDSNFGAKYILITTDMLEAGKNYPVEINGLVDTLGNTAANVLTTSVTVIRDEVKPTFTVKAITENVIDVTFDKEMNGSSVDVDSITVTKSVSGVDTFVAPSKLPELQKDKKTFRVTLGENVFGAEESTKELKVEVKNLTDILGNKVVTKTEKVTVSRDIVKPTVVSVVAKASANAGTPTEAIVTFSENIATISGLSAGTASTAKQGIFNLFDSNNNVVKDDGGTEVYPLIDAKVSGSDKEYSVKFTNGTNFVSLPKTGFYKLVLVQNKVQDLATTPNMNAASTTSFKFTRPAVPAGTLSATLYALSSLGNDHAIGGTVGDADVATDSSLANRIFVVAFDGAVVSGIDSVTGTYKDGAVENIANYKLDNKALPTGTVITRVDASVNNYLVDLSSASIDEDLLPKALLNGGKVSLSVSGVKSPTGALLAPTTSQLTVADKTEAVLKSAYLTKKADASEYYITATFSEEVKDVVIGDFVFKEGSNVINLTDPTTAVAAIDPTDKRKVKITITDGTDVSTITGAIANVFTLETISTSLTGKDLAENPITSSTGVTVVNLAK